MDVVGFLCVSLGSSIVQLHDSLGGRRAWACPEVGFNSQNEDRSWGVHYRKAAFFCAFLWAKGPNAKDMNKEMFPVYGGMCLSRKAVHNWVANVSMMTKKFKRRCRSGWDNSQKDFYAAGFDALIKRRDKCIKVGGRYVEKYIFSLNFKCYLFYVLYPSVTHLLTLPQSFQTWIDGTQECFKLSSSV
jgi:hypothetical protein